ncbi:MAG: response regulator, partial [Acidimicrobiales bacterium]
AMDATSQRPWPAAAAQRGESVLVDLPQLGLRGPTGPWPEPPTRAFVTPLRPQIEDAPYGFLVVGLNPCRPFDADYQGFVELIAGQIAAGLAGARAYDDERRRAEELAELDRAKTAFFTNVSHEFRTPLTLLLGPAEDALADLSQPLEDTQRRRLELIRGNARRLLVLVNSLLDFSKLSAGHGEACFQSTDLAAYTSQLAAMFQVLASRAGLQLLVDCPPLPEAVFVDRDMWAKVVLNLLSNAVKFTFSGTVSVTLREARDVNLGEKAGVELVVADTGIGITPADQARLFERFHRVVGARSRSFEGTGIGLALVSELVGLHGGTVSVDSRANAGTTFRVQLPFGSSHLPDEFLDHEADQAGEAAVTTQAQDLVADAMRWLLPDGASTPDAAAAAVAAEPAGGDHAGVDVERLAHVGVDNRAAPHAPSSPALALRETMARVLVVDDNPEMRAYLTEILGRAYAVEVASDGVAALHQARSRPPDVIITDVMMPNLDGFGLLAALRADPVTAAVPIIMLSARAGEDGVVDGLQAGADDYLVKPFSARELMARVRTHIELDRARRGRRELERSRALLDQAQRLAGLGSWELNLETGRFEASEHFHRVVGTTAEEVAEAG